MSTVTHTQSSRAKGRKRTKKRASKFENAAEWWHALGDVPLSRVIFNPLPGTATEKDLLTLVERDKRLCELIDGTLVEKPVGYEESHIAIMLAMHLLNWVRPRKLGVVTGADGTLRVAPNRIRLPDVAFVSAARLAPLPRPWRVPHLSPDLAVEVLSETNTKKEMTQKLDEYFEGGTRLVWIIDPKKKTVAIYVTPDKPSNILSESDVLDGDDVLPGFTLQVKELFESPI
jgi:Uma2 family endonuclease